MYLTIQLRLWARHILAQVSSVDSPRAVVVFYELFFMLAATAGGVDDSGQKPAVQGKVISRLPESGKSWPWLES